MTLKLVDFLTSPSQQLQLFDVSERQFLPTRISADQEMANAGFACPPATNPDTPLAIVLPEQDYVRAVAEAAAGQEELVEVLNTYTREANNQLGIESPIALNPSGATAAINAEPGPIEGQVATMFTAFAPVTQESYTQDTFDKLLLSEVGVIVGGAFGVDSSLGLGDQEFTVKEKENFLVKWRATEGSDIVNIFAVAKDGSETFIQQATLHRLPDSVGSPLVVIEKGSWGVCWYLGNVYACSTARADQLCGSGYNGYLCVKCE